MRIHQEKCWNVWEFNARNLLANWSLLIQTTKMMIWECLLLDLTSQIGWDRSRWQYRQVCFFFFCDLSSKHGSGRDQALISLNDFQHSNATSLKTWNLGVYSEQTQQWIQLGIWNHLCVFSVAESTQKTMEMHMLQFPRRSEKYIRNLFFIMEIPKKIASRRVKRTPSTLH